jgi:CTP:molybdopterin cytidylyltransferase MocA
MVKIEDHVATIVLAAGYSSRMGAAFKPLLKLGDGTVVERAVQSHLDAGIQDVRVVVGYRGDEVIEAVKHLGVSIVRNRHFDKGMFSSIQAGVATLKPQVQAFFIMPGDIPLVDPTTIRALLEHYKRNARDIIYPIYRGKKGHPPLITSRYISEIMESPAPDGLRGILNGHEAEACGVEVDDEAVLLDIDILEDYSRLLCHGDRGDIPGQAQCTKLLDEAGVAGPIRNHCCLVASVACQLVRLLNNAGADLDEKLVGAAALLHDIRRSEKNHALAGAIYLRTCGYARVADIVAAHIDIESAEGESPTEAEIVYLADKLVMGQCCVPLKERFAVALERHKGDEKARMSVLRRQEQAKKIKKKVERIIGYTLEEIPPVNITDLEREGNREALVNA